MAALISFVGETISTVDLSLVGIEDDRALQKAHSAWMSAVFGRPGPDWKFEGGKASSLFDPRGGGSSILFRYS